ncbi:MAG: BMP family ABC transporter substrate-binding protein [Deltaproteobacteria bacterium]|nr:BMP family ABC transporter substrate-binding protein [Deltaproteobacteria bacterium]MBI3294605.1 BMP family ABC transporter substrate-binding protein [Deltaproteobacteria bacterium]
MLKALLFFSILGFSLSAQAAIKVGLVLDKGGKDDKSFNAAAFRGASEAEKKLGITLKTVESSDDTALEPSLRTFSRKGYDLVIGVGFAQLNPIKKVAAEFPKTHFLLIDSDAGSPNVRSVMFAEHEGSYLVGVIAGMKSQTKTVGFVGGMDIPLIRRFEMGYRKGAESIGGITVVSNYVGSTSDAWRNPTKGKELALAQISKKADVIFAAAGTSGMGVFDAAEEKHVFAIGVDSNQNWVKPGTILTSMLKHGETAVYQAIEDRNANKFTAGLVSMGLSDGGVGYALDEFNKPLLTPAILKKVEEVKKQIVAKQLKVPDYYSIKPPQ